LKKVLLTSTALVMTAGVAAAEMTMSASAKLTYGNFGTGNYRSGYSAPATGNFTLDAATGTISQTAAAFDGSDATAGASAALTGTHLTAARTAYAAAKLVAGTTETAADAAGLAAGLLSHARAAAAPDSSWSSEADLDIAGSGGGGNVTYSATLELDESGEAAGAFTIASGGLTFVYDANDVGTLVTTGADGEDDSTGDYMVSYAAGGLSASYETDTTSEDTEIKVGYASGDLTVGLTLDENNNAVGGDAKTTTSVGYVMGSATIAISADDQDDWDASVAYVSGSTTMTLAADEESIYSLKLAYASGDMTFTARQEFGGTAAGDSETEFGMTYAAGDLTFGAAYDSGQAGKFGDEAETVVNASYAIDGATLAAKATDQDEVEVSVSFAF
jgi:outer membrane protein OmpU